MRVEFVKVGARQQRNSVNEKWVFQRKKGRNHEFSLNKKSQRSLMSTKIGAINQLKNLSIFHFVTRKMTDLKKSPP